MPSRVRPEAGGPLPFAWMHVIFWSGLRGAVSTALALSLPADFPNRSLLQGITLGVVLFTLLVQATTAELVVSRWGRESTAPVDPRIATAGAAGAATGPRPAPAGPNVREGRG